jgi:formylglycine-generating enzyme required for sulfatase activity/serine/threonine protein kinase
MKSWSVTVFCKSGEMRSYEFKEGLFLIGADPSCELVIPEPGIGGLHTSVRLAADKMHVEDLGSPAGTRINGRRIRLVTEVEYPAALQLGETLVVVEPSVEVLERDKTFAMSIFSQSQAGFPTLVDPSRDTGEADTEWTPPDRVANVEMDYRLKAWLGGGAWGAVYSGLDPVLERQVAVKMGNLSAPGAENRFVREAELLAQLAHPNIVPIYNLGEDTDGRPFYSMKLQEGKTLQEILHAQRAEDPEALRTGSLDRLLTVFQKVCDAVAFAHQKGVLHLDLKPQSVLVGGFGEVLVSDWGKAELKSDVAAEEEEDKEEEDGEEEPGLELSAAATRYLAPEQALETNPVLDECCDVYALGGILFSILTLMPPVAGRTQEEVLAKIKKGELNPFIRRAFKDGSTKLKRVGGPISPALQAVTLKAMALDPADRYQTVTELSEDIDAFQRGFPTRAEDAGFWQRSKLWVGRNRGLTACVLGAVAVAAFFAGRLVLEQKRAARVLAQLREAAPTFAARATAAAQAGDLEEALKSATHAVDLQPTVAAYHRLRGNALQSLVRWNEALPAYREAIRLGDDGTAAENLTLTEELAALAQREGQLKAKVRLFEALRMQGRQNEALSLGREMTEFWRNRKKDPTALGELVSQLESKLLPVPGTRVRMSKTECTVAEWKLYLAAEALPPWQAPKEFPQTDEHPVVNLSWKQASEFCDWLSAQTGKPWRLPTDSEWTAANATTKDYPWGDSYPPKVADGNYAVLPNGVEDPKQIGVDGVFGTSPVAAFKANALGFSDLGGNAAEWTADPYGGSSERRARGGDWRSSGAACRVSAVTLFEESRGQNRVGLRLVCAEKRKDTAAFDALLKRLEAKLVEVPGRDVLMSRTEVTVEEWKLYLAAEALPYWQNPKAFNQTDTHPVVDISWREAKEFSEWLSTRSGKEWRMPVDEEWDAAVGQLTYPWGDHFPPLPTEGHLASGSLAKGTKPVATHKPNALGIHDLAGNVAEWSWDGFVSGGVHAARGGGWDTAPKVCQTSSRQGSGIYGGSDHIGLRLVRGKDRRRNLAAQNSLLRELEQKLVRVPGTLVRMPESPVTLAQWKLYLEAEALPELDPAWTRGRADSAPLLGIPPEQQVRLCQWLSLRTGKKWRPPTEAELAAALDKPGAPPADPAQPQARQPNLGFYPACADRTKSPELVDSLVSALEAKLLPVGETGLFLGRTEVTVGEWKLYLSAEGLPYWKGPAGFAQTDEHPLVNVSWNQAREFCEWLTARSGKEWRLPSSEEWETAAGKYKYPWGNYFPPTKQDGNYRFSLGTTGTSPVGSFPSNPLKLCDIGGNVAEWTSTRLPGSGAAIVRGGGWSMKPELCLVSSVVSLVPDGFTDFVGFRLARQSEQAAQADAAKKAMAVSLDAVPLSQGAYKMSLEGVARLGAGKPATRVSIRTHWFGKIDGRQVLINIDFRSASLEPRKDFKFTTSAKTEVPTKGANPFVTVTSDSGKKSERHRLSGLRVDGWVVSVTDETGAVIAVKGSEYQFEGMARNPAALNALGRLSF